MSVKSTESTSAALRFSLVSYVREYLLFCIKQRREGKDKGQHGLSSAFVRELQRLDSIELDNFAHFISSKMIRVHKVPKFCLETLVEGGETLLEWSAEKTLIRDFACQGASQEMLQRLFGLRKVEVSDLRAQLDVELKPGRPRRPTEEEEQQIVDAWLSKPDELDDRLKLFLTSLDTQISLNTAWNVVQRQLQQLKH